MSEPLASRRSGNSRSRITSMGVLQVSPPSVYRLASSAWSKSRGSNGASMSLNDSRVPGRGRRQHRAGADRGDLPGGARVRRRRPERTPPSRLGRGHSGRRRRPVRRRRSAATPPRRVPERIANLLRHAPAYRYESERFHRSIPSGFPPRPQVLQSTRSHRPPKKISAPNCGSDVHPLIRPSVPSVYVTFTVTGIGSPWRMWWPASSKWLNRPRPSGHPTSSVVGWPRKLRWPRSRARTLADGICRHPVDSHWKGRRVVQPQRDALAPARSYSGSRAGTARSFAAALRPGAAVSDASLGPRPARNPGDRRPIRTPVLQVVSSTPSSRATMPSYSPNRSRTRLRASCGPTTRHTQGGANRRPAGAPVCLIAYQLMLRLGRLPRRPPGTPMTGGAAPVRCSAWYWAGELVLTWCRLPFRRLALDARLAPISVSSPPRQCGSDTSPTPGP